MAQLKYEDERKRYQWASKPKIRKYDHIFNGKLTLSVGKNRQIRDNKSSLIEDRLGEILVAVFYSINAEKLTREAREEAQRQREAEQRRKEEIRRRYNSEVQKTNALVNRAEDYAIACKIRALISAVESQGADTEETQNWLAWAKAKADWYDPTVAAEDDFFGKRVHDDDPDQKALKERYSSYW